jgi:hypothetical protein
MARDAAPAPDVVTVATVTRPSNTPDGLHAPGLRFGDPRTMALVSALVSFVHLIAGFTNAELTRLMTALLNQAYTARQATYDLRRLRRKGIIERRPGTHRYLLTPTGREIAVLLTKTHTRILGRGLAILDPALPATVRSRHPLAIAWRHLDNALDDFFAKELLAA